MYIDISDGIGNEYNTTYHSTIKMEPANLTPSAYTDFGVENKDKPHKFKVDDHVKISKHGNIFAKVYTTNWGT